MNKADQQVLQAQTDAQRALMQQQQAMVAAQQHAAQQAVVHQHQAMAAAAAQMGMSQQQGTRIVYKVRFPFDLLKKHIYLHSILIFWNLATSYFIFFKLIYIDINAILQVVYHFCMPVVYNFPAAPHK